MIKNINFLKNTTIRIKKFKKLNKALILILEVLLYYENINLSIQPQSFIKFVIKFSKLITKIVYNKL